MMSNKNIRDILKYWVLPKGFQDVLIKLFSGDWKKQGVSNGYLDILKNNKKFKNIHEGKRCFIIANGPSIKTQDLRLLKNEICFSVNNGFVHPNYKIYKPMYHCLPQIEDCYAENKIKWLTAMDEGTLDAHLFTSVGNKKDIEDNGLFKNRVSYVYFNDNIKNLKKVDLTKAIPNIHTVPHMSIMIAIYMGFKQIYLLGCDQDSITHWGTSSHFYDESKNIIGKEVWGEKFEDQVRGYICTLEWYENIRLYAEKMNIKLYNATNGGLLDVFERVNYEKLFNDNFLRH